MAKVNQLSLRKWTFDVFAFLGLGGGTCARTRTPMAHHLWRVRCDEILGVWMGRVVACRRRLLGIAAHPRRNACYGRPLAVLFDLFVLLSVLASTVALLVIGLRGRRESPAFGALAAACAVVLLAIAVFILTFPVGHRPNMTIACIVNLSNLNKALLMYEGDNDGMTPPGRWVETLQGYYTDYAELKCPVYDSPIGYALNTQMEDVDSDLILNPVNTVAFFDAISSAGNTGGEEAIAWRHNDERAVFSFADGHCRPYKRAERPSFAVAVAEGD